MNANVSFRHMESSPPLRNYATGKLERIVDKYVHGKIDASVVMSVEKIWHIANFTLQIKNLTIRGHERSEDMYSSIDLALAKIEKQLRRHKDRLRDHKPSKGASKTFRMGVVAADAFEPETEEISEFAEEYQPSEVTAADVAADNHAEVVQTAEGESVTILRQQEYQAKTMTLDEAALQLNLLEDREFFVFTNAKTGAINVIFHRSDKKLGLIET